MDLHCNCGRSTFCRDIFSWPIYHITSSREWRGTDASAPAKSIAVLPFENRSEDKANAFFADGIQDEILTRLAKIAELKVISRTSTQRYKSSPENISEIARQLGVEHVLEGAVQKAGEQVRVTVQLIRGGTDTHVWAETYDRKLTDIFAVESEIAETVARSLQAKLTPHERKVVSSKPTENSAAYEAYLRGLALWNKTTVLPEDSEEIVRNFSRAVELDPKFALGWAFLSVAHSYRYREFDPTPTRAAQAKETLDRARSLQADLGETHFADGMYQYKVRLDFEKALNAFQKARDLSANRAMAVEFSSYVKRRQGKWDEALRLHEESLEIDPRNPIILSEAAITYRALRRFDEAEALIDRAHEIAPENVQLLALKAEASFAQGDSATAGRLLNDLSVDGRDPLVLMACVRYWVMVRRFDQAIHVLKRVVEGPEKVPEDLPMMAANLRGELAIVEVMAGNPEAKTKLERSRDELKSIWTSTPDLSWTSSVLLVVSGFLQDKATVDLVAAKLHDKIENDALSGAALEQTVAIARAHLGETDVAIQSLKELLKKPGENALTPALLVDPFWDPLRNDPRFQELANSKL
jgi:TolB-like protein/tetratricopeptide (TPR) repeat protein